MPATPPATPPAAPPEKYFTSVDPFHRWFSTGTPMLMYHKLGPRPWGAKIKGLYVSTTLFEKQMAELAAAGFKTVHPGTFAPERMVISFDDGFENVLRFASEPLRQRGFTSINYLVAGLIGRDNEWERQNGEVPEKLMDEAQVRDWLAAGHQIGAHSVSHPFLTRVPLHRAREEITASKKLLEDRFQVPVRHFCYPYGDHNPAIRALVMDAGYQTACTTAFGINTSETDLFAVHRIMARHPSRSWKKLKRKLLRRFAA